jgi:hypothetical protein
MQRSLLLAKDLGIEKDHAVQSRLAVTLMTGSILLGKTADAKRWFQFGHRHAVAEGDLACIDGLLFNRAVFGLARQRIAWSLTSIDPNWCAAIRAELVSARNLQNMVGITTMRGHIDLCMARLDLMEGHAQSAIEGLDKVVALDHFAGKHVNSTALAIDRLFAQHTASQHVDLEVRLAELNLSDLDTLDPDERLVAMTMLIRLNARLPANERAEALSLHLQNAKSDYEDYENALFRSLSPWLELQSGTSTS